MVEIHQQLISTTPSPSPRCISDRGFAKDPFGLSLSKPDSASFDRLRMNVILEAVTEYCLLYLTV